MADSIGVRDRASEAPGDRELLMPIILWRYKKTINGKLFLFSLAIIMLTTSICWADEGQKCDIFKKIAEKWEIIFFAPEIGQIKDNHNIIFKIKNNNLMAIIYNKLSGKKFQRIIPFSGIQEDENGNLKFHLFLPGHQTPIRIKVTKDGELSGSQAGSPYPSMALWMEVSFQRVKSRGKR